jgi:hypothetical protein
MRHPMFSVILSSIICKAKSKSNRAGLLIKMLLISMVSLYILNLSATIQYRVYVPQIRYMIEGGTSPVKDRCPLKMTCKMSRQKLLSKHLTTILPTKVSEPVSSLIKYTRITTSISFIHAASTSSTISRSITSTTTTRSDPFQLILATS